MEVIASQIPSARVIKTSFIVLNTKVIRWEEEEEEEEQKEERRTFIYQTSIVRVKKPFIRLEIRLMNNLLQTFEYFSEILLSGLVGMVFAMMSELAINTRCYRDTRIWE